ncbi:probable membrane-associated kinase regulator 1 [Papaver somniferum]|uniref:probable membrane-associated kinase regulator 1 n=1 Tax=Papaver somniferum TaxID=3469 RepID=UPI000E703062|nr:probable membrane-associated kinase regulator 1 [Papaver somniferum]
MGKTSRRSKIDERSSRTLPSSPTHSSSSSDFEFLISLPSPHKLSSSSCPAAADELFFKGQILPLHISPRLSMLQSLGSSSSSSASSTTNSRDSTSSSNDLFLLSSSSHESSCNSSCRPSSVTEELELLPQLNNPRSDLNQKKNYQQVLSFQNLHKEQIKKPVKYFSLSRFSNVFRKDQSKIRGDTVNSPVIQEQGGSNSNSVKKMKEMVSKYMKKVKPFYEKLSSKQQSSSIKDRGLSQSQSFSENILYPRKNNNNYKQSCIVSSCPSSMRSSPSRCSLVKSSSSSIEELQNAIQGAITHCKNSYSKSDNKF